MGEVVRVWQGGCIIRSKLLKELTAAKKEIAASHFLMNKKSIQSMKKALPSWRRVVAESINAEIATPALTAALQYYQSMTTVNSPANLIQGMRDFFGAHTYERTDKKGIFHSDWSL
jgi:6-phosphogluconate dehydrogenase